MVSEINRWTATLNDFTHIVAVRKMKSNQPIHASNQTAVFEINLGYFKRPFQEPSHGTDSSLALPDQYLPTFFAMNAFSNVCKTYH